MVWLFAAVSWELALYVGLTLSLPYTTRLCVKTWEYGVFKQHGDVWTVKRASFDRFH